MDTPASITTRVNYDRCPHQAIVYIDALVVSVDTQLFSNYLNSFEWCFNQVEENTFDKTSFKGPSGMFSPWADPEGGTGGPDPPGIAKLLIFAMLKFSIRPLLGTRTP